MKIFSNVIHNTAGAAIVQILKDLGHFVYIPSNCKTREIMILKDETSKSIRNLNDDILDSIPFWTMNPQGVLQEDIPKIINRIVENYEMMIFCCPHLFSNLIIEIIQKRIYEKVKIVLLFWGDIVPYTIPSTLLLDHPNFIYCISLSQIQLPLPDNIVKRILPLPLDKNLKEISIFESQKMEEGMIIISRIGSYYSNITFEKADLIRKNNIKITFCGKNNENILDKNIYKTKFNLDIRELYIEMSKCDFFLYLLEEKNMIQYAPLEAIFLNKPVFYFSNSLLNDLIDNKDDFYRCQDLNEMIEKIQLKNYDLESIKNQRNCLKYFDGEFMINHWRELLTN